LIIIPSLLPITWSVTSPIATLLIAHLWTRCVIASLLGISSLRGITLSWVAAVLWGILVGLLVLVLVLACVRVLDTSVVGLLFGLRIGRLVDVGLGDGGWGGDAAGGVAVGWRSVCLAAVGFEHFESVEICVLDLQRKVCEKFVCDAMRGECFVRRC
jgi:hypothetical protein